ncbi:MAG: RluA family pseudouridine synthase [Deltaproteobacteria bacterium]|nr:RluA family pseudouridine synthase [Deltaproteobacteria bacterium]
MRIVYRVPADAAPARLDRYLADVLGLSRRRVTEAFEAGAVRVDGKRARKGDKVLPGSEIVAEASSGAAAAVVPQPELALSVLVEDPAVLVLDKPAGMPAHPLEESEKGTLGNALIARFPECATASDDPRECGLAHRLDVETSGAMVAARSPEAWKALRAAFSKRIVEKRYLALVGGAPGEGGEIDIPIAHHPRNPRKMVACALPEDAERLKARPAVTRYKVLERLGDYALVEAEIPTGVMHQIRIHLAAVGAPVAGDTLYGGPAAEGLTRQFLHAARLAFPHPVDGRRVEAQAPLPPELEAVLRTLRTLSPGGAGVPPAKP